MKPKKLKALNIRSIKHLCKHLGTTHQEVERICKYHNRYFSIKPLIIKGKERKTANARGRLRQILDSLQSLLQRVELPDSIQGGIRGCSNITNAKPHINKPTVLNADLKDFFSSVTNRMVYKVFTKYLGCTPEVARYLTILTTAEGSFPQGFPTSTILASIVLQQKKSC